jgi:hypothetical protein
MGAIASFPGFGYPSPQQKNSDYQDGGEMKNPLDTLWGTVISGLVLTLILYNVVRFALQ